MKGKLHDNDKCDGFNMIWTRGMDSTRSGHVGGCNTIMARGGIQDDIDT